PPNNPHPKTSVFLPSKPPATFGPAQARLRAKPLVKPCHIVLVEPEIPQNTGNIARLSAAVTCPLHLVGRLGFRIDEHAVRRAGVDYWHLVDIRTHATFGDFLEQWAVAAPGGKLHLFSATATKSYLTPSYAPGDALVFGKESVGLPRDLLASHSECAVAIPTLGAVRSLNLANAVSIAIYEALRQMGALAEIFPG
ncbi:MAG: tRNA (cytidine(34)-2'-O)-methyltransferase, partial [Polyangiaceae bacterium]